MTARGTIMLRRAPVRARALVACTVLAGALLGSCAADDEGALLPPATPDVAGVTADWFGAGTDPAMIVAEVDGASVTAADVAAYLELFPTLTVEQAVQDLVDARVAVASAPDDVIARVEVARQDARRDALAISWLRHELWTDPALAEPDPGELRTWLEDPARSAPFGVPELARVSHLLVRLPEGATDADAARATEALNGARQRLQALGRAPAAFDLDAEIDAVAAIVGDQIPDEDDVTVERHFAFPRVHSGPARWSGVTSVVEPFAAAAFALEVNELSEPVRTDFGVHLILLEERIPAYWVPDELRERMARDFTLASARTGAFNERLGAIMQRTTVYQNDDNIGLLGMTAEERLTAEARSRGERFGQDDD